ncbi:TPA: hypothetical protein EYN23_02480 [Candidatus Poribacteria bacterium]|nr:hypothetical protein [Candidatus Poribacteria bacterium]
MRKKPQTLDTKNFLRAANIEFDSTAPENLAHFRPTRKSIELFQQLANFDRSESLMITGPYGTGKSITTAVCLHWLENYTKDSKALLRCIGQRIGRLNRTVAETLQARIDSRSKLRGLVITLHGYQPDLPKAIQAGIAASYSRIGQGKKAGGIKRREVHTFDDVKRLLREIEKDQRSFGIDKMLVVWDEFGRHLEKLVELGSASDLNDVQTLAEFIPRMKKVPVRLAVILHQSLQTYSGTLNKSLLKEWAKIEARFVPIDASQDGPELYGIMQDVVESLALKPSYLATKTDAKKYLEKLIEESVFEDMKAQECSRLFGKPLHVDPLVYFCLPRIASRVAQNERTIFNFLAECVDTEDVNLSAVYNYFSVVMQHDTSPGGAHQLWQQTSSALTKAQSDMEIRVIHNCAILTMAKIKVTKKLLKWAVGGQSNRSGALKAIQKLCASNVLHHRQFNDEVILWHGTDAHIREKITETVDSYRGSFDYVDFLRTEYALPILRPVQHNDKYGVNRYFRSYFCTPLSLQKPESLELESNERIIPGDGAFLYMLHDKEDDFCALKNLSKEYTTQYPSHIVVLNKKLPGLFDICLQLYAVQVLQRNENIKGIDPVAEDELRLYSDDTRGELQRLLKQVVTPTQNARFVSRGSLFSKINIHEFRVWISEIADETFSKTPRLFCFSLNRHKPSSVMVNARKKLTASILENSNLPEFGFNNPDELYEYSNMVGGLYRTALLGSGIYGEVGKGEWRFRLPEEISSDNPGLKQAWKKVELFFTEPTGTPKPFSDLLGELKSPPFGMREGLFPVVVACAMRTFSTSGVLMHGREYLGDVRPTDIEALCKEPTDYFLEVVKLDKSEKAILQGLTVLFPSGVTIDGSEPDELRLLADGLYEWKTALPRLCRVTEQLSKGTLAVRAALLEYENPARLITRDLPEVLRVPKGKRPSSMEVISSIDCAKSEIEMIQDKTLKRVASEIREALQVDIDDKCLREQCKAWSDSYTSFPDTVYSPKAKALLTSLSVNYDSDNHLVEGVTAVVDAMIRSWDDRSFDRFRVNIHGHVREVLEGACNAIKDGSNPTEEVRNKIAGHLENRLRKEIDIIRQLLPEEADQRIKNIFLSQEVQEVVHG